MRLALIASFVLFVGCGEDPLGSDDEDGGSAQESADDRSDDGTAKVSSGTPRASVPSGVVQGKVNDQAWSYASGGATIDTYSGKTSVTVRLFASEVEDPCAYEVKRSWLNAGYVKFTTRTGPDEADVYDSGSIYFYDEKADVDDSAYASDDDIEVTLTEQTATQVSGTVDMVGDVHNQVAGAFTVKICD